MRDPVPDVKSLADQAIYCCFEARGGKDPHMRRRRTVLHTIGITILYLVVI